MSRCRTAATAILAALPVLAPTSAQAQLFSPGKLSRYHRQLEGLSNCLECHSEGERLSNDKCLVCHGPIRRQVKQKKGYHGRNGIPSKSCDSCHSEHEGVNARIIRWPGGSKNNFNHNTTGYPLRGKHGSVTCSTCHQVRLIKDAAAKKTAAKKETFLGLSTSCRSCHFDEHRGQTSGKCEDCHTEENWKKTPGFKHNRDANFRLRGKHRRVACFRCHPTEKDTSTPAGAFPAPVSEKVLRFKPVAHARCSTCHRDPHDGAFGSNCAKCHSEESWHAVKKAADTRFHEKTRFPLKGEHASVECKACHGPWGRQKAKFKGLAFNDCTDCHMDSHVGQLTTAPGVDARKRRRSRARPPRCENCHTVATFSQPAYSLQDHGKTSYPLEASHRAVPCNRCHKPDAALEKRVPTKVRELMKKQERPVTVSRALFDIPGDFGRCDTCHANPHAKQFAERIQAKGCTDCHQLESFQRVVFDHDAETSFALTGGHSDARCNSCHRPPGNGSITLYEDLPKTCESCHRDPHVGQFDGKTCATCHSTDTFSEVQFDHNNPDHSAFPLEGRHSDSECTACHREVTLASKVQARRYKPLPAACESCHEDYHQGAYRGFDAAALFAEFSGKAQPSPADATARAAPDNKASGAKVTKCDGCHTAEGWAQVSVSEHDVTGFPLEGAHALALCSSCHGTFETSVVMGCGGCHQDPHAGELGPQCGACHDSDGWETTFDVSGHRARNFPLVGRHAVLPCQQCHTSFRRGFVGASVRCVDCHQADYDRTGMVSIDHAAAGFDTSCRRCHQSWRFAPAQFPQHDTCFAITRGPHAGISCAGCHTTVPSSAMIGTCATLTADCTQCHEHRCSETDEEHTDVPGYECQPRKCYECHRFTP